jgi:hypothetical protein
VKSLFPDAKFVFITRNGWDVIRSVSKWSQGNRTGGEDQIHDWWGVNRRKWNLLVDQIVAQDPDLSPNLEKVRQIEDDLNMAAVEWIETIREASVAIRDFPEDVYVVSYEGLTRKPHETLESLLEFCNLPQDDIVLKYAEMTLKLNERRDPAPIDPVLQKTFQKWMDYYDKSLGAV